MSPRVAVLDCPNYDVGSVEKALREGLDFLEIYEQIFSQNRFVLKPNLLSPKKPEEAVTTHPSIVESIARICHSSGPEKLVIGDTPGGPFNVAYLKALYRATGMEEAAKQGGAELNYDTRKEVVKYPEGKVIKKISRAYFLGQNDYLINMAKMKTHGLTRITGGVKNLFGIIPGLEKVDYHLKLSEIEHFAALLVDIARFVNPFLTIIDGVDGMEGAGPSGGDIKKAGKIIISDNVFAADVVMAKLMGLDPLEVPTIKAAENLGLPSRVEEINVKGSCVSLGFKVPSGKKEITMIERVLPDALVPFVHNLIQPRPVFIKELCSGCEICSRHCPPGVISGTENKDPEVDLNNCIRCFCCQELCPYKAVKIKRSFLGKLLFS